MGEAPSSIRMTNDLATPSATSPPSRLISPHASITIPVCGHLQSRTNNMPVKSAAAGQMGEAKPDSEYIDNASGQAGPAEEYAYLEDTPEERALVRKIDRRLLPMLWVMVSHLPGLESSAGADPWVLCSSTSSTTLTVPTSV